MYFKRMLMASIMAFAAGHTDVRAQNLNPVNTSNVVPPSPEVAAFTKYIDMPVGYSSGIPQISIPIYNIKNGDLEAPVSLSYHAGGVRVADVATWVGLGWNLNYGGSVSRTVRGLPDDYSSGDGYMYTSKTVHYTMSLPFNSSERLDILYNNANQGELDVEPDVYTFSALGYSGKFYYSQDSAKFLLSPNQRIRIEHSVDGNQKIIAFRLVLPNGVKCYFGRSLDSSRTAYETFNSSTNYNETGGTGSVGNGGPASHITAWQLLDVVNPSGKSIRFYYTNYSTTDFGRGGETTDYAGISGCVAANGDRKATFYVQSATKAYIQKISSDAGEVFFIPSSVYRQDVADYSPYLDSIKVKDNQGNLLKAFVFSYSYTLGALFSAPTGLGSYEEVAQKRLYLNALTEVGKSGAGLPPYSFSYIDTNQLPSRLSTAQDYWGFYNGKSNGSYLTPKVLTSLLYGTGNGYLTGADRTIDTIKAKAGTLNKIRYPAGGTTEYFYEQNVARKAGANPLVNGYELSGLVNNQFFFYKATQFEHPANSHIYSDTFTIPAVIHGDVRLVTGYEGCTEFATLECPFQTVITGITDPEFYLLIDNEDFYETLPAGDYRIQTTITIVDPDDPVPDFTVNISWMEDHSETNLLVGGLRVYKIISSDSAGNRLLKTLSYNQFSDSLTSSGELVNLPVHAFKVFCGFGSESTPAVLRIVSNSELPLTSTSGEIVRYANVAEFSDEHRSSFKTEYTFSNDMYGYSVPGESNYPYPTNVARDWRTAVLLNKKQFEKISAGNYRVLTNESYLYQGMNALQQNEFGIRIGSYPTANSFGYTLYSFITEWYLPDSVVTQSYAYDNGNDTTILTSATKHFYNSRFAQSIVSTQNSKGQAVLTKTWYPYDYNEVSGYNFGDLITKNIIDVPVRTEQSTAGKITGGQVIKYDVNGNPVAIYAYEYPGLRDTVAHNANTVIPSWYELKTTIGYTGTNEINSVNTAAIQTAYLWDYSGTYPIASVWNSTPSLLAYTSFEADGTGNWSGISGGNITAAGITGSKHYEQTGFSLSKSGLSTSQQYTVSYWSKNGAYTVSGTAGSARQGQTVTISGQSWTCYQHTVTGVSSVTVSGTGAIDELRLYPAGAQMTTYTYDPLIGMTSQCDINNRITWFEYDNMGRLLLIRDQDRNILKTYTYTYREQQ